MEDNSRAFKILTGEPARKRHFGRCRHGWEDSLRIMDLKEMVSI
jgi:hypothetical protein